MIKQIKKNEKLQAEIDRQGRKQVWIAEKAGIDTATFSRILNGLYNVNFKQAQSIADVLGVDIDDIF